MTADNAPNPADRVEPPALPECRLLVIDDTPGIHVDFHKILRADDSAKLDDLEAALFGSTPAAPKRQSFRVDSACQGSEGFELVRQAKAAGQPYALAFVDVNMPPGWDGIETIRHLWEVDPDLQIVLCTAYADYSWRDLYARLGRTDNLSFLRKPFENVEVLQLVHALSAKLALASQVRRRLDELDRLVAKRTQDLREAVSELTADNIRLAATELRLSAFATLGRRLSEAQDSKAAAEIIVEVADHLLGWDACICHLYSASEDLLFPILTKDIIDGRRAESTIVRTMLTPAGYVRRAIQEGGQLVLREFPTQLSNDTMPFGDKGRPSASILWVPVRKGQEVIGALSIQSYTHHAYDQNSLETLQALADHCSGALNRIKSEEILRQTEEQLRQSQKMEAIGLLAGGVAHDFNNLLAVILGNAELAMEDALSGQAAGPGSLRQIVDAANRAGQLTKQLLAFSRKQVMTAAPLDLNHLVNQLGEMLKRIIGQDIQLRCTCVSNLPLVQADAGMIDQAVMNLVVNARDAMAGGGEVEITTEMVDIDSSQLRRRREARAGRFVCLSVKDRGTGIAPADLTRIFEPFFTTKGMGKGTGLGLSTVFGIVKQHQGWVEVQSKIGVGSTFQIFLPALAPVPESAVRPTDRSGPPGGSEVILYAEDEVEVRRITRRILEMAGYRVLETGSGPEALAVWEKHSHEIDMLLSDILMPGGLSGQVLAGRLTTADPALKVILMSGYTGDFPGEDGDKPPRHCGRFLQKPCSRKDLLRAIREVLDEPAEVRKKLVG